MDSTSLKAQLASKKTLIFFILATLLFLLGTAAQFKKSERSTNNDFRVYYKTSVRIQNAEWGDIYTRKDGPFPYRYVPYTLTAVTWMEKFPEQTSRKIWLVLQALTFAVGFIFLYKALAITGAEKPLLAVSLTVLLTFRQYMDSLYSGQVAGFVFLSFCLGMYFYLRQKYVLDGAANSVATTLKVMPGFLLIHGLIKVPGLSKKLRFLAYGILLFVVFNVFLYAWLLSHNAEMNFLELWKSWASIVVSTGEYFDGSTPKSQSLRAFILRTFGKTPGSETIWKVLFLISLAGVIIHWIVNQTQNKLSGAYSYCLGILAFILLMPETLPYQLMNVAIPFAVIISDKKLGTSKLFKLTFVAFMIFISFASTDFIGRNASDWMQDQSFAFFVTCLMAVIVVRESQVVKT